MGFSSFRGLILRTEPVYLSLGTRDTTISGSFEKSQQASPAKTTTFRCPLNSVVEGIIFGFFPEIGALMDELLGANSVGDVQAPQNLMFIHDLNIVNNA
ncbi:uncharacterized protein ARMOST_14635 [Armillaria ostoyae]|uniref:Uncharacterized protein n=1 Tax=Armillaria ostoyae TaxID=47428 RepID=A0A284RR31_ARMOS|nr:uncharacterized protein ARMOST_14635 [Armillaria ostoyae]